MKKLITIVAASALSLLCTSCFQQQTTISLNKDGSGTVTETVILGPQMIAMVSAGNEGADPLDEFVQKAKQNAEETVVKMGEGVSVKEVKALNKDGKKGTVTVYAFKDINKLKYVFGQGFASDEGDDEGAQESDPLNFNYKGGVLTVSTKGNKPADGNKAEKEEIDEQGMAMAKAMMADMYMGLSLEFPDGIAESDAKHTEGNKVVMVDLNFGKFMADDEKFRKFMETNHTSFKEVAEQLDGVDGVKVETAEKFTVKLK